MHKISYQQAITVVSIHSIFSCGIYADTLIYWLFFTFSFCAVLKTYILEKQKCLGNRNLVCIGQKTLAKDLQKTKNFTH
ncbi:MAG: hypothetical protein Q4C96_10010 [Planctomycetia bacterium]|nr:hypothetical protein [Planctomycetia bacterium]